MKKQNFAYSIKSIIFSLMIFITLLVNGCTPEDTTFVQGATEAASEQPTLTPTTTRALIIPTDTVTPILNLTDQSIAVTPSVIPTMVPSSTPTITPVATLTLDERQVLFQELMHTNGGCDLPCWWGFELGDSLDSISETFVALGLPPLGIEQSNITNSTRIGVRSADYYDQNGANVVARLSVDVEFHELDNAVEYINIDVNRPNIEKGRQELIRDWQQYYLSSFLQRYGKPTQVYFRIRSVADLMNPPQFSMSLLYLEKGLAITYHIEATWLDEEYTEAEICLEMKNLRALELSLFDPDSFDEWGYQFAPFRDETYEENTWESVFDFPLDSFYETYQNPENLNCLFISSS